jgi:hypothetical protein
MEPTLIKFLLLAVAGWVNREQQVVIEYLRGRTGSSKASCPKGVDSGSPTASVGACTPAPVEDVPRGALGSDLRG